MSATYTVPGRKWCNLNGSHGNHHAHQSLMDEWQANALRAIHAAGCQAVPEPVVIIATVRRTRNGRADAHNVTPTIKACIDAAVTAELISDDHDGIVHALTIKAGPKAPTPTVEIEIRPVAS